MDTPMYIGTVELSVHLSSMNPLGYIDERTAYRALEKALVKVCREIYFKSEDRANLEEVGIVPLGGIQKYFHFSKLSELIDFCEKTRAALLEKNIPFKICCGVGKITNGGLSDQWFSTLDEYVTTSNDERRAEVRSKLISEFATDDVEVIEKLFRLYRSPSFHGDIVQLSLDAQNFKGLGISIPMELIASANEAWGDRVFVNYFPVQTGAKKFENRKFIDLRFDFSPDDLAYVWRSGKPEVDGSEGNASPAGKEELLAAGSIVNIEGVLNLLRHSVSARGDSVMFYVSILTNFVRSSDFSNIEYLESDRYDEVIGVYLKRGWQNYPPIFSTLFSATVSKMLKGTAGIDLVLGSLIDKLLSARSGDQESCTLVQSDINDIRSELIGSDVAMFDAALVRIRSIYGEVALRRILDLPNDVISLSRKKLVLKAISK